MSNDCRSALEVGTKFYSYDYQDLEVQLVQLSHCDWVYSNYWNTLLGNLKLSPYINFYV